nr:hypothetical protein GTC16762_21870 [Pigmentibacter ruber]
MKLKFILIILFYFPFNIFAETETIFLNYQPRIPFFIEDKKEKYPVDGTIYKIIQSIFQGLDIEYKYSNVPVIRTLQMIKENKVKVCYPLGLRNIEREKIALISKPIYKDKNTIVLYNIDNEKIKLYSNFTEMLKDKNITLLVKIGYSYGKLIDEKLLEYLHYKAFEENKNIGKNINKTSDDNIGMLNQILNKKSDYMLIAKNEIENLIEQNGIYKKYLKILEFKDLPEGEYRHLICSKKVGEEVMEKINSRIKILKLPNEK